MAGRTSSRAQLIGLLLLFLVPLIAAWVLFYNPDLLPSGRSNKGALVSPVIHLESFQFKDENNVTIYSDNAYKDYWTVVLFAGESCDSVCRQRIHDMHQIRKALQADYQRVKRLVIIEADSMNNDLREYVSQYQGTDVLSQDRNLATKLSASVARHNKEFANNLFIMDPMLNIMMNYDLQHTDKDILADMTKLLKVNQWGSGH